MEKRVGPILLMLSLETLLLVAGLSAAAVASSGDMGTILLLLPSDAASADDKAAVAMASASRPGGDEERPGACCDRQRCTRSSPPLCSCHDRLERCSDACRECGKVRDSDDDDDPPRYVCKDMYFGEPAPRCHEDQGNEIVVLHGGPNKEMAFVMRRWEKGNSGEERPWKCCDKAVHGPTTEGTVWYCMDKMEHCTCERCMEMEKGGHFFCLDGYGGRDPGPSCTHDG